MGESSGMRPVSRAGIYGVGSLPIRPGTITVHCGPGEWRVQRDDVPWTCG